MIPVTSTLGTNLGRGLLHYSPPRWHYYLHLEKQKLQCWKDFVSKKTAVVHCIGLDCCDKHLQKDVHDPAEGVLVHLTDNYYLEEDSAA